MFSRLRRARRPQSPATIHSLQSLESRLVLAFAIAEPQLLVTGSPDGSVVTGTDGKDVSGPEVTITGNPVLVMPTGDPEAVAYTTAVLTSIPAGTVTASVSRSGDISITGDADSNSVTVDIGGGYVTLSSPTGTRFRLAGQPAVNGPLAFALPAAVRSLSIDLRGGDDSITALIASDVAVRRDVNVNTGAGNDFVAIEIRNADVTIGQNLTVDLGAGNDRGQVIVDQTGSLIAARDITFRTAAGADSLLLADNDLIPLESVSSEEGITEVADNSEIARNQRIRAGRDMNINLGSENDLLTMLAAEATRDLQINSGSGSDAITATNIRAGRNLASSDAEKQFLQNLTAVGTLQLRSGSTADQAVINNLRVNRLDVNLGAGNDRLSIGGSVNARSGGNIDGGTGANTVRIASAIPRLSLRRSSNSLTAPSAAEMLSNILMDTLALLDNPIMPSQIIMAE